MEEYILYADVPEKNRQVRDFIANTGGGMLAALIAIRKNGM